ncbi:fibrous sheath-interacting protein 1 isoform X2 [Eublepharis macularius]|uniref:Fibrous sheath-interacting protein 1 n=1 Tax=Eublepharis macularius TaxID=481883 RepID=A0AA97IY92_EUBMA|nr:fibrous sheath-interacting protein 1 isoform X2 [Eublepharis macularius]
METTKESLDEISRPFSSSRINHRSKALCTSLEILTPEPDVLKVDYSLDLYNDPTEDNSKENDEENGEKYETEKLNTSEEISEGKMNSHFQQLIQNSTQVKGVSNCDNGVDSMNGYCFLDYIPGSTDSEDNCAESKPSSCSSAPQDKRAKLQTAKLEDSKESNVDPLIQQAIKKMKRLDQILANKQSQEKAIKKQGKEMRTKLWEELQSMTSRSSSVTSEEDENTSRFLALASETSNPTAVDEGEMFIGIFHTQINSENYEYSGRPIKQGCLNAERTRSSMKKVENIHQKTARSSKKHDFIKKNIELIKDFGNQVVMLEEEKKRLSELLNDTEDERSELQILEGETTGWLIPGEGYTPEPMEYHYLTELDAQLKVVTSDADFSTIQSSSSKVPKQIYQESLAYANRKLETVPGEKVLRDTKEECNQQNRLREIDQQLKNLERTPDVLPSVSKEQLDALLEEYMPSQRTVNRLALPTSEESYLDGMSAGFDQSENSTQDPRNYLLDDPNGVGILRRQEMFEFKDKDVSSKEMMETSDCNDRKALVESHLSQESVAEKKDNHQEVQQEMLCPSNSAGYFMSIALSTDKLEKPSFLDEPFYCISMNNGLSSDVDIPNIPLKTRGGEVLNKLVE